MARIKRPTAVPGPASPADSDAVGRAVMEHLLRLEERSIPGLAADVMPVFLRDTTLRLAALRDAMSRADSVEAHRMAHTIHGSVASIGAATMLGTCAEILRHVRAGNLAPCPPLIAALTSDLESIRRVAEAHGITAK
jgi:HPt (histidine-containing phosphotransfer) domain-containing protein